MGVRGDMEQGGSLYKPKAGESGVEYGPKVRKTRLLPFEKHLIEVAGCTEEEYIRFTEEVRKQSKVRPAGYEHIPEVVAGPGAGALALYSATTTAAGVTTYALTWLGQLVVGLVLSYVAYLLTPKPKAPDDPERRQLGDLRGRSRFASTTGFESQAELADYASPIPIIFGLYRRLNNADYGGVFVSPPLVWSRMFSHGRQQSAKLMFVIGEAGNNVAGSSNNRITGIERPDLKGIYIGRTPLDSIYNNIFAFYWKTDKEEGNDDRRINTDDLVYGTRGATGGDPQPIDGTDPFVAPINGNNDATAFCSVHSLTNNSTFGCYSPIPNGTPYRVNWRVISMPEDQSGDGKFVAARERVKISGRKNYPRTGNNVLGQDMTNRDNAGSWHSEGIRDLGMEGIGRNYARRMGLIRKGSASASGTAVDWGYQIFDVSVDDIVEFRVSHLNIPKTFYSTDIGEDDMPDGDMAVRVDDINSFTENERIAADDALQVGEVFSIGGCTFVVTRRDIQHIGGRSSSDVGNVWVPPMEDSTGGTDRSIGRYWLKCIEVPINTVGANNKVGIVNEAKIVDALHPGSEHYVRDMPDGDVRIPGANFFPLMKESRAIVSNSRLCSTTEIGIRSRVFQQLNGICNFQTLPSAARLVVFDEDNIQVTEGTTSTYIARTSFFRVEVKKEGQDDYSWIPLIFGVTGNAPVDVYNWISFTDTGSNPELFTFRFVPESGASIRRLNDTYDVYILSASGGVITRNVVAPSVSSFRVKFNGVRKSFGELKRNREFTNDASDFLVRSTESYPNSIGVRYLLPHDYRGGFSGTYPTALEHERWYSVPTNTTEFVEPAFMYELLGDSDGYSDNEERWTGYITEDAGETNRKVKVRYRGKRTLLTNAGNSGKSSYWRLEEIDCDSTSVNRSDHRGFDFNSTFLVDKNVSSNNPFKVTPSSVTLTKVGSVMRVRGIDEGTTSNNNNYSRLQAFLHHLFGNATDNQQHETNPKTVEETYDVQFGMDPRNRRSIRLRYTSTVRSATQAYFGQYWFWNFPQIDVIDLGGDTETGWGLGRDWEVRADYSTGNPFSTNPQFCGLKLVVEGMSSTVTIDTQQTAARTFESYSQAGDVSFYSGVIKSNESSPEHTIVYVNEIVDNGTLTPNYDDMTIAGLSIKAGKQFNSLDQINLWLGKGIPVRRFHPERQTVYGDTDLYGPSNLLTDLVYYLITDLRAGAGSTLNAPATTTGNTDTSTGAIELAQRLIYTPDLESTSKFLYTNKLFFNGAIDKPTNLRQFLSQTAPMFLCNFVISNGKFSIRPAVPINSEGEISNGAVPIQQLFTSGNILENTFKLSYLKPEERKPFRAMVRYTEQKPNKLPKDRNIVIRYGAGINGPQYPPESFDLTRYCTNKEHAILVAKFFLALRKHVTHTVEFETIVTDLTLAPGDYIKVVTESSPYSAARNGSISANGTITSNDAIAPGQYNITYYSSGSTDVNNGTMNVGSDGRVVESSLYSSVFTIRAVTTDNHVYLVEQLTITEDNTAQIVASHFPCDTDDKSMIALDLLNTSGRFKDSNGANV